MLIAIHLPKAQPHSYVIYYYCCADHLEELKLSLSACREVLEQLLHPEGFVAKMKKFVNAEELNSKLELQRTCLQEALDRFERCFAHADYAAQPTRHIKGAAAQMFWTQHFGSSHEVSVNRAWGAFEAE